MSFYNSTRLNKLTFSILGELVYDQQQVLMIRGGRIHIIWIRIWLRPTGWEPLSLDVSGNVTWICNRITATLKTFSSYFSSLHKCRMSYKNRNTTRKLTSGFQHLTWAVVISNKSCNKVSMLWQQKPTSSFVTNKKTQHGLLLLWNFIHFTRRNITIIEIKQSREKKLLHNELSPPHQFFHWS